MDSIKFVIQTDFDELNGYSDAVIDYKGVEANKPLYQYRPCEKKELEVVMPLSFIYTTGAGNRTCDSNCGNYDTTIKLSLE